MLKHKIEFRDILALINCIGGFTVLILLFFKTIPKENETMINIALGAVIVSGMGSTLSYYFGASKATQQQTLSGTVDQPIEVNATIEPKTN